MARYKLTELAESDLDQLFTYGILHFGINQAERYSAELIQHLKQIANNSAAYPKVEGLRKGYRRSVFQSHSIYYQIVNNEVLIVRVLGRQNPQANL